MPITIADCLLLFGIYNETWYWAIYCLYWLHYSVNFYVYAGSNVQFRQAYVFFLKEVISPLFNIQARFFKNTLQNLIFFTIYLLGLQKYGFNGFHMVFHNKDKVSWLN